MSTFAGSAIKQGPNVGRIDKWSEWNPNNKQPVWLLLSGACDPPEHIGISSRKERGERSGNFLGGISDDLSIRGTIAQMYHDRDTFHFIQGHATKNQPMAVPV